MRREDAIRIQHMIEAAEAALSFTAGRVRTDLDNDRQFAFALARAIEICGEAATKVSAESRALVPNVPWLSAIGMRNRIVHAYFDIDFDIWSTATEELPRLLPPLRTALEAGAGKL